MKSYENKKKKYLNFFAMYKSVYEPKVTILHCFLKQGGKGAAQIDRQRKTGALQPELQKEQMVVKR